MLDFVRPLKPVGRFMPHGKSDRLVVVADTVRTATAAEADFFLPVEAGRHFEALWALRALIRGAVTDVGDRAGAPAHLLVDLARRMNSCRSGVVFFGVELARGESGHCNVQALLQLITDLNERGRWYAMRMRVQGNVVGADSVLIWQTGYPFAVNMARGYPRYNPGEFSVQGLLERQEADVCLLVGSETLGWLSEAALAHLRRIPTVILDPADRQTDFTPSVRFTTGAAGIHVPGTVYRMDGVPIPVRAVLPTRYPSDREVLEEIGRRL